MEESVINGVDTKALAGTMDRIGRIPEMGRFTFRARNLWQGGARNTTSIAEFQIAGETRTSPARPFRLAADEPEPLHGQDTAPNPAEALLHALAACVTTSMTYHAALRGIRIDDIETELVGQLDLQGFLGLSPGVRPGFEDITVRFRVTSDATAEELRTLCEFSPVLDVVAHGTRVILEVESLEEPAEERWAHRPQDRPPPPM